MVPCQNYLAELQHLDYDSFAAWEQGACRHMEGPDNTKSGASNRRTKTIKPAHFKNELQKQSKTFDHTSESIGRSTELNLVAPARRLINIVLYGGLAK